MRREHNDWDDPLSWQRGLVNAARTVKEERERRTGKIQALWLACETQEAIAEWYNARFLQNSFREPKCKSRRLPCHRLRSPPL